MLRAYFYCTSKTTLTNRPVARLDSFFLGGGNAEPQKVDLLDLSPLIKPNVYPTLWQTVDLLDLILSQKTLF